MSSLDQGRSPVIPSKGSLRRRENFLLANFPTDDEIDSSLALRVAELLTKIEESKTEFRYFPEAGCLVSGPGIRGLAEEIVDLKRKLLNIALLEIDGREEVHGLTRTRVRGILDSLDEGSQVSTALRNATPPIDYALREYLKRWGITDRLSFENVIFGFNPSLLCQRPGATVNWQAGSTTRGLFPKSLLELTLGRKLENLSKDTLTIAGDLLFGALPQAERPLKIVEGDGDLRAGF